MKNVQDNIKKDLRDEMTERMKGVLEYITNFTNMYNCLPIRNVSKQVL